MCITVDKSVKTKLDKNGVGVGYKYFSTRRGLRGWLYTDHNLAPYPKGRWLKASNSENEDINAGWHIMLYKKGLAGLTIDEDDDKKFKVKFRYIKTTGVFDEGESVVAKEMLIMGEIN